jgi:hypothetical protein
MANLRTGQGRSFNCIIRIRGGETTLQTVRITNDELNGLAQCEPVMSNDPNVAGFPMALGGCRKIGPTVIVLY